MSVTGVGASAGRRQCTIYVNWINERNGAPDVFVGDKDLAISVALFHFKPGTQEQLK